MTTKTQNLKAALELALKKIGAKKESEICRFLPGPDQGYIHHFTFKKLKHNDPEKCCSLIEEFILKNPKPRQLDPKPRASRGVGKSSGVFKIPKEMMDNIMKLVLEAGDMSLFSRLQGSRSLSKVKRELIKSIKENKIDESLWFSYKELISKN